MIFILFVVELAQHEPVVAGLCMVAAFQMFACFDTRRSAVDHRQDQSSAVSRLQSQIQNGNTDSSQ